MARRIRAARAMSRAVLLAAGLALAAPSAAPAGEAPVELPLLVVFIGDGAGGRTVLRARALLQPRDGAGAAAIAALAPALAAAMRKRLRRVTADRLIPPEGGTAWLERELWGLAERMLAPVRLDGLVFRELTIE